MTKEELKQEIRTLLKQLLTANSYESEAIAAQLPSLWRELRSKIIRREE